MCAARVVVRRLPALSLLCSRGERDSEAPETGRSCGNPAAVSQKHVDQQQRRLFLHPSLAAHTHTHRVREREVYSSIMSAQRSTFIYMRADLPPQLCRCSPNNNNNVIDIRVLQRHTALCADGVDKKMCRCIYGIYMKMLHPLRF